ncbi:hypothetical protein KC337_g88 [Hortaea werneckii]|nr:hypothetical protein KC337_g88 [Hortaea werneckii]
MASDKFANCRFRWLCRRQVATRLLVERPYVCGVILVAHMNEARRLFKLWMSSSLRPIHPTINTPRLCTLHLSLFRLPTLHLIDKRFNPHNTRLNHLRQGRNRNLIHQNEPSHKQIEHTPEPERDDRRAQNDDVILALGIGILIALSQRRITAATRQDADDSRRDVEPSVRIRRVLGIPQHSLLEIVSQFDTALGGDRQEEFEVGAAFAVDERGIENLLRLDEGERFHIRDLLRVGVRVAEDCRGGEGRSFLVERIWDGRAKRVILGLLSTRIRQFDCTLGWDLKGDIPLFCCVIKVARSLNRLAKDLISSTGLGRPCRPFGQFLIHKTHREHCR